MPRDKSQQKITSEEELFAALAEETFIKTITNDYRQLLNGQKKKKKGKEEKIHEEDFRADLTTVARDLMATATIYRMDRAAEVLAPRVSAISRQLAELSTYSTRYIERWLTRLAKLKAVTIEALLGGFPFAVAQYTPVEVDDGRDTAMLPVGRSTFVPGDDRQQRQDLKHLLSENPKGLVKATILPSFIETFCMKAEGEALAGMVSDMVRHLTTMQDKELLRRHLVKLWSPFLTDLLEKHFPAKLAALADKMEDGSDQASSNFLEFLEREAPLLFQAVPAEPGKITAASRLAAGIIEPILKADNLDERRAGLRLVAARNPPGFQEALTTIVERIERQYDKDINPTGMGRRTTRSYVAPATWKLINDVLNRVWPAKNGSPTKATRAALYSIVEATHTRGELEFKVFGSPEEKLHAGRNTGIGNIGLNESGDRKEQLLVYENIKLAASYRNARYQLNCALEFLEHALREVRYLSSVNDPQSMRLEATIRVVHLWREEMDWRLLHGAYEKAQWRMSSITLPRFPQFKPSLSIEERVKHIETAAGQLIKQMLATISGPSPAQV